MGSPYLSSNESIILSTSDIVVNAVPAEAILTNERLVLVDTRHAQLRPQDIPFSAIEAVTIGESATQDPMLSLSLVTGPGVTQPLGMVFPQAPRMKRVAERDEWAARLKELSIVSARERGGSRVVEILPPWVPGPLPEESAPAPVPAPEADTGAAIRHAPLAPRRTPATPSPKNRTMIAVAALVIIVIAVAAIAYVFAPSLLGKGGSALPVQTPVPVTAPTQVPAAAATTVTAAIPATAATPAGPQVVIPQTGVWVMATYDGSYSGSVGAPGRFRQVADSGTHWYQIPAKDEIISVSLQKQDNSGKKLTAEVYNDGKLIQSASVTSPKGLLDIDVDLRNT